MKCTYISGYLNTSNRIWMERSVRAAMDHLQYNLTTACRCSNRVWSPGHCTWFLTLKCLLQRISHTIIWNKSYMSHLIQFADNSHVWFWLISQMIISYYFCYWLCAMLPGGASRKAEGGPNSTFHRWFCCNFVRLCIGYVASVYLYIYCNSCTPIYKET